MALMTLHSELTASLIKAQAEEKVAAERTNAALIALKQVSTWARMEELTGLTRHQLQYRLYKNSFPSIKRRLLTDQEKQARRETRIYPHPVDSRTGIGPAEAARRLGVSRTTVYAMLKRDEFEPLKDASGRQRIATDTEGKPLIRVPQATAVASNS